MAGASVSVTETDVETTNENTLIINEIKYYGVIETYILERERMKKNKMSLSSKLSTRQCLEPLDW